MSKPYVIVKRAPEECWIPLPTAMMVTLSARLAEALDAARLKGLSS